LPDGCAGFTPYGRGGQLEGGRDQAGGPGSPLEWNGRVGGGSHHERLGAAPDFVEQAGDFGRKNHVIKLVAWIPLYHATEDRDRGVALAVKELRSAEVIQQGNLVSRRDAVPGRKVERPPEEGRGRLEFCAAIRTDPLLAELVGGLGPRGSGGGQDRDRDKEQKAHGVH